MQRERLLGRTSSASAAVRPLSSRIDVELLRAVARRHAGPGGGVGVHPLTGATSAAAAAGTRRGPARSAPPSRRPTTLTSASGRVRHIRPLPSDSTTTSVPVSATAKFAPETATFGAQELLPQVQPGSAGQLGRVVGQVVRRGTSGTRHPLAGRSAGSPRGFGGSPAPGCGWAGRRRAARSAPRGRSPHAAIPAPASASLRPISWVAIDLTLTTSSTPWAFATAATTSVRLRRVTGPVHRCAPAAVSDCLQLHQVRRQVVQCAVLDRRAGRPQVLPVARLRRPRAARLSRIVPVACARLCRSWVSARAAPCGRRERRHADEGAHAARRGARQADRRDSLLGRRAPRPGA